MIQVKKYEIKSVNNMLLCLTVIVLASDIVRAQQAQPYQYAPQPYQNAFNYDRRRLNAPYSGFSAGSLSQSHTAADSIKFPDESAFAPGNGQIHGTNGQYSFNARNKKDMIQNDGTQSDGHSHRSNEVSDGQYIFYELFFSRFLSNFITSPYIRDSSKRRKKSRKNTVTFFNFFFVWS